MNSLIATRAGLLNSKCFPGFSCLVKDQWNFCENRCVRFSKLPLFNFTVPRASSGICSAFSPTSCGGACKIVLTIVDLTSNSTRKSHHFHLAPGMGTIWSADRISTGTRWSFCRVSSIFKVQEIDRTILASTNLAM